MDQLITDIIAAMRQNPALTSADVDRIMRLHNGRAASSGASRPFTKRRLMPYLVRVQAEDPALWASWGLSPEEAVRLVELLRVKPRRTQSGVATITLITRPEICRGRCIFCPTEAGMPKSYLSDEPACQRAVQSDFDPYLQVSRRLLALWEMGHPTGKVELIILGGTWDDYPAPYRIWFVKEAFRALNDFTEQAPLLSGTSEEFREPRTDGRAAFPELFAEQHRNEIAASRCVGLVVETRPDCVTAASLTFARSLGATKIQVGVQSLDEGVLDACCRPMDAEIIHRAFAMLRLFGFKSHIHWMLNLPESTPELDVAGYRTLMEDPRFRPDEVKLYPCMLIRGAALERLWESGAWVPYTHEELVDTCARCLLATPEHTRISRMIRDFSAGDILAGDKTANLRQEVEFAIDRATGCKGVSALREMRSREITRTDLTAEELQLKEHRFPTTTGEEVFLEWVTGRNRLAGFLRLSLPAANLPTDLTAGTPYAPDTALIREVHVYGTVANVGDGAANAQHQGLGTQLVQRAVSLARQAGYSRLGVISAVGTRGYYERLGFASPGPENPEDAATLYQYRPLI